MLCIIDLIVQNVTYAITFSRKRKVSKWCKSAVIAKMSIILASYAIVVILYEKYRNSTSEENDFTIK